MTNLAWVGFLVSYRCRYPVLYTCTGYDIRSMVLIMHARKKRETRRRIKKRNRKKEGREKEEIEKRSKLPGYSLCCHLTPVLFQHPSYFNPFLVFFYEILREQLHDKWPRSIRFPVLGKSDQGSSNRCSKVWIHLI